MTASLPVLFAGPSLVHSGPCRSGLDVVELRPPAVRGDIARLVSQRSKAGTVILADGCFHSELSVGHAELRRALREGWAVFGVSSMGAIRACEMRSLGMIGFGRVYEMFVSDPEMGDDEVALLHGPEPAYVPFSEPMVHVRAIIDGLLLVGQLRLPEAQIVLAEMKQRWFGYRTMAALKDLLMRTCSWSGTEAAHRLAMIEDYRVKSRDLMDLLARFQANAPARVPASGVKRFNGQA